MREVGAATHFLGQSESTLHFGLGPGVAEVAEVHVHFPASGRTLVLKDLAANRVHRIVEPQVGRCGLLGLELLAPLWLLRRRLGRRPCNGLAETSGEGA